MSVVGSHPLSLLNSSVIVLCPPLYKWSMNFAYFARNYAAAIYVKVSVITSDRFVNSKLSAQQNTLASIFCAFLLTNSQSQLRARLDHGDIHTYESSCSVFNLDRSDYLNRFIRVVTCICRIIVSTCFLCCEYHVRILLSTLSRDTEHRALCSVHQHTVCVVTSVVSSYQTLAFVHVVVAVV